MRLVNVLGDTLEPMAILQNARDVTPRGVLNGVGGLSFEMPYNDPKCEFIQPFAYIETTDALGAREDIYRVLPQERDVSADGGTLAVECEHVLATLLDDVMPGWNQMSGRSIRESIEYILSFQSTPLWALGDCEYDTYYEYGWQHEHCLTALFGIFAACDGLKLEYDVSKMPWLLHVRRLNLEAEPTLRIAWRHNMVGIKKQTNPANLATRLYCYGYGEGVNQLSIAAINGGLPYIEDVEATQRYGHGNPKKPISGFFIAREIEDANLLLAAGQSALRHTARPRVTYEVTAVNLFESTKNDLDRPAIGKIVKVYDELDGEFITYVTGVEGDEELVVTLTNTPDDVANTIAKIADRQRIEQTYAQGSTQLYGQNTQVNATPDEPAVMDFYCPQQLRYINSVNMKVRLSPFRAYTQNTSSGGGSSSTSDSDGGTSESTSSGGSTSKSTSTGGGGSTTSASNSRRSYETGSPGYTSSTGNRTSSSTVSVLGSSHYHTVPSHTHDYYLEDHTHSVSIPSHSHDFTVPSHTHSFDVPNHRHGFSIPSHTHEIEPGIFLHGSPASAKVMVNGIEIATIGTDAELDITAALVKGDGTIPRGAWQTVEILPNDLAYVTIDLVFQGFIQSRGGGNY